jgi:hypothetical protein
MRVDSGREEGDAGTRYRNDSEVNVREKVGNEVVGGDSFLFIIKCRLKCMCILPWGFRNTSVQFCNIYQVSKTGKICIRELHGYTFSRDTG